MKTKILFGSIAAVVLMVLASCSSVVGAETNLKETKVSESVAEIQKQLSVDELKEKIELLIEKTSDENDPQPASLIDILATILGIILEALAYIILIPFFILMTPLLLLIAGIVWLYCTIFGIPM